MNSRLDTLKSLAETDPYYRGYLDGMNDKHGIGRDDDRTGEYQETIRLLQARLDRRTDTTDYDSEWARNKVPMSIRAENYRRARDLMDAELHAAGLAPLDALVGPVDSSPVEEVRERLNARKTATLEGVLAERPVDPAVVQRHKERMLAEVREARRLGHPYSPRWDIDGKPGTATTGE